MTVSGAQRTAPQGFYKIELRGGIGRPDAMGNAIYFADVRKELLAAWSAKSLLVVIDSGGGLMSESDKIYSVIRSHPAEHKVAIIVVAASAAIKVVLASPRRWARHDASLLIHSIEVTPGKRWTASKHEETAKILQCSDAELAAFYARRTGKATPDWFLSQMRDDRPMSLATALECGLIHKVIPAPARSAPMALPSDKVPLPPASRPQAAQTIPYLTRDMWVRGGRAGSR